MEKVEVDLGERRYGIKIGTGLLAKLDQYLAEAGVEPGTKLLIITDERVKELYGTYIETTLHQSDFEFRLTAVPEGEGSKSLEMAQQLYDEAVEFGLERNSAVIAFGGGVVGDLAGFIAATYMRGISLVQVPTTLLAQVDSSVGGKVAVNHEAGKNLIGAFYQPEAVIVDLEVLTTLDSRDIKSGLAEVIKYGVIWDNNFFNYLQTNAVGIRNLDFEILTKVIQRSCQIKAEVVTEDEKEEGLRAILNYGHTIGHAIEALAGYGKYRHGEAVAIGMVSAVKLAHQLEMVAETEVQQQIELISSLGLPTTFHNLDLDDIISKTKQDKKVQDGQVRYILPNQIGEVKIVTGLAEELIIEVLDMQCQEG